MFNSSPGWDCTKGPRPVSSGRSTPAFAWTWTTSRNRTLVLFIDPDKGGQAKVSEDDYVEDAPELVAEVAASSASYDLNIKLDVYRRNGVREYLVWRVHDRQIDWFVLERQEVRAFAARRVRPVPEQGLSRPLARPGGPVRGDTTASKRPSSAAWPAASTPTSSRSLNARPKP